MNKLNADRISAVRASLGTDERLVWIGQANAAAMQAMMRGLRFLGLMLALLAAGAVTHEPIAAWLTSVGWDALTWPIRTLLIALALMALGWCLIKVAAAAVPPSYAQQRAASLIYAVTDQRLIHVDGSQRWDTPLAEVLWVELTTLEDGTGSINHTTNVFAKQGHPEADTLCWHGVPNAIEVALLICEVAPHARLRDRSPKPLTTAAPS